MFTKICKETFLKLGPRRYCSNVKRFEEIPTLSYLDIIKLVNPYNDNNLRSVVEELFSKYGSIVRVRVPGSHYDNLHICEPSDVQILLKNEGPHPVNQAFSFFVSYRNRVRILGSLESPRRIDCFRASSLSTGRVKVL